MGLFGLFGDKAPDAATLQAQGARVIDVRSRAEFTRGHVSGAKNYDVGGPSFESSIRGLSEKHTYVVYCQSGSRSRQAAARMRAHGLTVIDGGGVGKMAKRGWDFV